MTDAKSPTATEQAHAASMTERGLTSGQAHEFLIICPLKKGGADRMKKELAAFDKDWTKSVDKIGTVHDFRYTVFDNDTRFLFASTYDGDFVQYIKDFSTIIPEQIDMLFKECEGYPGVTHPEVWDYFAKHQVEALVFYSAYPPVSVRQVKRAQRVLKAFEDLLDEAQS